MYNKYYIFIFTLSQSYAIIFNISGGDVWVLAVKEVNRNDSGIYSCEVNSVPEVRSYHQLNGKQLNYLKLITYQFIKIIFKKNK